MQVLDARTRHRRHLVERLRERRPEVPDAGVAGGVESADAPVVGVVAVDDRRGQGRRDRRLCAANLGAGRKVLRGVDLDLVLRGTGNRSPRELRIEVLGSGDEVADDRGRGRGPRPREARDGRCASAVSLGVERRDAPVVRALRQEVELGDVVCRPCLDRLAATFDEVGESGVTAEGEEIACRVRDWRPVEPRRGAREGKGESWRGRQSAGCACPALAEGARPRPR